MRPGEWLVLLSVLFTAALSMRKNNRSERFIFVSGTAIILIWLLQIFVEGFRWQSWGLVLGSIFVLAGAFYKKPVLSWISFLPIGLSILLMILFPIPAAFEASGALPVGTDTYYLVDPAREEIYGPEPGHNREFMVQVWYPAIEGTGTPTQWMPDIDQVGPVIAQWLGLPDFFLDHLKYAKSYAEEKAEPALVEGGYPLLVFSHGWSGFKEQNSALMEEFASYGYVVASINHTYGAIVTVFPDGRAIPQNPDALPGGVTLEEYDAASNLLVRQWAGDIAFTIESMKSLPQNGMIDFDRIGVLGHSTGAGAAIEFCAQNSACGAVFAMDPWMEPVSETVRQSGLTAPGFFLFSENWDTLDFPERNYAYAQELVGNSNGQVLVATVAGTKHLDFSMLPLLSPLTITLGLKGPIDGDRILEIMNVFAVTFFEQNFNNATVLPETLAGYPEVNMGEFPVIVR